MPKFTNNSNGKSSSYLRDAQYERGGRMGRFVSKVHPACVRTQAGCTLILVELQIYNVTQSAAHRDIVGTADEIVLSTL